LRGLSAAFASELASDASQVGIAVSMLNWRGFGCSPAVPLVAGYYLLVVMLSLLLSGDAATFAGLALLAVLGAYCVARPSGGLDIFLLAAAPAAVSAVAEEIADIPRWWIGAPMMLIALLLIAQEEREARTS
jgi:hypothetical protein